MTTTPALTVDSILIGSDDILESDLGTEKVMMSIEQGRYYGLNEMGKRIHDGCDGKTTLGQIIESFLIEFEIEAQECETKVLGFASTLFEQGLLELATRVH